MGEKLKFVSRSKIEFSRLESRTSKDNPVDPDIKNKYISFLEKIYNDVLNARLMREEPTTEN